MSALVIGIDPASSRLALVARHPILPVAAHAKYILGKKYSPSCCAEAMDSVLAFLDSVATMATGQTKLVAFLEGPTTGFGKRQNLQSSFKQAFVSGVIQACLVKSNYTVHIVPPNTWKLAVVGKGNATKDDVRRAVSGRWPKIANVVGQDEDLNDAAAICLYGIGVVGRGDRLAAGSGL